MNNEYTHDFDELLNRYLDGRETPEELAQLMHLINSGDYDDRLQFVSRMLNQNPDDVHMDPTRYNRVLDKLRAGYMQRTQPQVESPSTSKTFSSWWLAAAAAVVIAVASGIWLYVKQSPATPLATTFEYKDKQLVTLPDGSTVVLNAGSTLTYTSNFGDTIRAVTLNGEGYFDVAHDTKHPFIVKAGTLTTTVLGTAFNINTNNASTTVTVTRGRVEVADPKGHYETLSPNQQATAAAKGSIQKQEVVATTATHWMDEFVILNDIPLEEATRILGDKYHIKFTIANPALRTCRIHATFFNNESLDTVLMLMGSLLHLEYERGYGTIHIKGTGC